MFSGSLPAEVRENAKILNKSKALKLTTDHNSFKEIRRRIKMYFKSLFGYTDEETLIYNKKKKQPGLLYELANIIVNIWYHLLVNFQLILFNYFSGFLCVLLQIVGFYYNLYYRTDNIIDI